MGDWILHCYSPLKAFLCGLIQHEAGSRLPISRHRSYWNSSFIVDLPIENDDFLQLCLFARGYTHPTVSPLVVIYVIHLPINSQWLYQQDSLGNPSHGYQQKIPIMINTIMRIPWTFTWYIHWYILLYIHLVSHWVHIITFVSTQSISQWQQTHYGPIISWLS